MGRFILRGRGALGFLNHVLTSNAAALDLAFRYAEHKKMKAFYDAGVKDRVKALPRDFQELLFCFRGDEFTGVLEKLHSLT